MKYLIYIILGLSVLQLVSCEKEGKETNLILKDGSLSDAIWKVEKMTTSSGVLIPNPDKGTQFENAEIFIEFNAGGEIVFHFMGLAGKGSYTLGSGNSIKVGAAYGISYSIGFDSKYRDLHYESMKALDHYSVEGQSLKLFYNNSEGIIHLVRQ